MKEKQKKSLVEMVVGESGQILTLNLPDEVFRHRMMDIGIAPNARVEVINTLHNNQLYILDVDDVEICIRREAAKEITVYVG